MDMSIAGSSDQRLALIGDIVASRKLENRGEVQQKLSAVLERLNQETQPLSPYTITLGDEFQTVYRDADAVFRDAIWVLATLAPVRVRFSIGVGTLSTPINRRLALGMDGPAFYRARDGIEQLKETGSLLDVFLPDDHHIPLMHQALNLFSGVCRRWRPARFSMLAGLYDGMRVVDIARRLGMSEQAVYKNITQGHLRLWLEVFKEATQVLNAMVVAS